MLSVQPSSDSSLQLIRNLDGLLQVLLGNAARRNVALRISLLGEYLQLLNQFGIGFDREFQRFDDLLMMACLHSGPVAACSQSDIGGRKRCAERRLETKIIGDRLHPGVVLRTRDDPEQVSDLFGAGWLRFEPAVFNPFFQTHLRLRSGIPFCSAPIHSENDCPLFVWTRIPSESKSSD